jgi:hypothetical protein
MVKRKANILKLGDVYMAESKGADGIYRFVDDGIKNKEWKTLKGAKKYLQKKGFIIKQVR